MKGVGKVHVQVVVHCRRTGYAGVVANIQIPARTRAFYSLAFGKSYTSKMPVAAADLLYNRTLPFYDALGVQVGVVLTDNGRESGGCLETHSYELMLAIEDIEHCRTQVRTPRTNSFVERMNRTLLDECLRLHGRNAWYESVNEIQSDLDCFLLYYYLERSHQRFQMRGRTPLRRYAKRSASTRSQLFAPLKHPDERTSTTTKPPPLDDLASDGMRRPASTQYRGGLQIPDEL